MAEQHDNERIRRGLSALVDEAPMAPDFHDLTTTTVRPVTSRKPRSYLVAGMSAAAVLATFAIGTFWFGESGGSPDGGLAAQEPDTTAPAPPTTAPAPPTTLADLAPGEFPRVVLDSSGWTMTHLDHAEGENDQGELATSEIQFVDGSTEVELRMDSGQNANLEELVVDRSREQERLDDQEIWDTNAVVLGSSDSMGFTALWESNEVVYEFILYDVNNERVEETTFRSLLAALTQTTEEDWIDSLPNEFVTDRATAISSYLEDVPLPPGFEASSLEDGPIEHWYGVAADAVGAVTCGWIEAWVDAKAAGDTEAAQSAVDAMAGSDDWQVLADMEEVGDYPKVVQEYAVAIAGDGTVTAGTVLTVEESYQRAFGCS